MRGFRPLLAFHIFGADRGPTALSFLCMRGGQGGVDPKWFFYLADLITFFLLLGREERQGQTWVLPFFECFKC